VAIFECFKCKGKFEKDDMLNREGRLLCEDCYLDIMSMPKVCDPWAVYVAKGSGKNAELSNIQEKILNLLQRSDPVSAEKICSELKISEEEFKRNFATLRHLELAKAIKSNGEICYTTFTKEL
jgi:predicted HTH transcriptional regulator